MTVTHDEPQHAILEEDKMISLFTTSPFIAYAIVVDSFVVQAVQDLGLYLYILYQFVICALPSFISVQGLSFLFASFQVTMLW